MDDKLKAMMETEIEKMSDKINLFFVSEKRKLVREVEKKYKIRGRINSQPNRRIIRGTKTLERDKR